MLKLYYSILTVTVWFFQVTYSLLTVSPDVAVGQYASNGASSTQTFFGIKMIFSNED